MTIDISPEEQESLRAVVSSGRFQNEREALSAAIAMLANQRPAETNHGNEQLLPKDEWLKKFREITESRSGGNPEMDDSRESIYGDDGR